MIHQIPTCNRHTASGLSTTDYANLLYTRVGEGACTRHGAFCPGSCVNFYKGERCVTTDRPDSFVYRQVNMDYALSKALSYNSKGLKHAIVMYDIMCQYGVHLKARFEASPYLNMPKDLKLLKGIGLFHVHGHQDLCFSRYAPNFIMGAGQVDGEIIETLWSSLNMISHSTRNMSIAHRREIMDAHINDNNWKKMVRMGKCFLSSLGHSTD